MKKLHAIIFVGIYLLFNLGISFNIHECENGKVEVSMFAFLFDDSDKEITHKCCHHHDHQHQQSGCECEDYFFLLDLSDYQISIVFSKYTDFKAHQLFQQPQFIVNNAKVLIKENSRINSPPPKPSFQKIISQQQLLFYA